MNRLAPAAARKALAEVDLPASLVGDARLVLSELVTNGVVHSGAREPLEVVVEIRHGTLRLEVHDRGRGFPPAAPSRPPGGLGGRGLMAVHRIADRWGVDLDGGTRVWVEVWYGPSLSRHRAAASPSASFRTDGSRRRGRREGSAARR
jgi:serine/threonine-protein kinase RsbW